MITVTVTRGTGQSAKYSGFRVLHKVEGGYQKTPPGMPEVIPPDNPFSVDMTEAVQHMSYDLMRAKNGLITPQLWTRVHDGDRAFTNFQGFGMDGDPRRNYITGEDPGAGLPKYDKAQRLCGGSFIHGEARGSLFVCRAGVHGIDADAPMPPVQTIIQENLFVYAVSIGAVDQGHIDHFPQGKGGPVAIPFIFRGEITFPLAYVEPWESDRLPDPLRIYRTV